MRSDPSVDSGDEEGEKAEVGAGQHPHPLRCSLREAGCARHQWKAEIVDGDLREMPGSASTAVTRACRSAIVDTDLDELVRAFALDGAPSRAQSRSVSLRSPASAASSNKSCAWSVFADPHIDAPAARSANQSGGQQCGS